MYILRSIEYKHQEKLYGMNYKVSKYQESFKKIPERARSVIFIVNLKAWILKPMKTPLIPIPEVVIPDPGAVIPDPTPI